MKSTILLFFLAIPICSFAQGNNLGLFEQLKSKQDSLPQKYTIVYSYTTWCGGVKLEAPEIDPVLQKFKDKINLIILADTTNQYYLDYFQDLHPEYLFINKDYPGRFHSKKERRAASADFNRAFKGQTEKSFGPGFLMILDCDHQIVKIFNVVNRGQELAKLLEQLPAECKITR